MEVGKGYKISQICVSPFSEKNYVKTVSSCFSSLPKISRVKHMSDRSTLTTITNTLVFSKFFIALPSGPMQRTRLGSSSSNYLWFQKT